jgi:hypothetical protein
MVHAGWMTRVTKQLRPTSKANEHTALRLLAVPRVSSGSQISGKATIGCFRTIAHDVASS